MRHYAASSHLRDQAEHKLGGVPALSPQFKLPGYPSISKEVIWNRDPGHPTHLASFSWLAPSSRWLAARTRRRLRQHSVGNLDAQIPAVKVASPTSHRLDSPLSGEVFTGSNIHLTCHKGGGSPDLVRVKFSVSGTASGPYPGTFTAHGRWGVSGGYFEGFGLRESFTISSGKYTFSGRIWRWNQYEFLALPANRPLRT